MNTPRWCYYVCEQDPDEHGGYVPSMVEEGVAGHAPLTGRGKGSAPWIWGQTLDEARKVCDRFNQDRLGISLDEASDIVLSSMSAQNREASSTTVGGDMKNPELACDWCGDEVINGEGVYVDDDRVCSECAAKKCRVHASDMTTFYLNINTDNDAFRPDPEMELARIFRVLSDQLEHGEIPATVPDINGNTVRYIHTLKNGIILNHVTTDA